MDVISVTPIDNLVGYDGRIVPHCNTDERQTNRYIDQTSYRQSSPQTYSIDRQKLEHDVDAAWREQQISVNRLNRYQRIDR
jgi:hypothetical protein